MTRAWDPENGVSEEAIKREMVERAHCHGVAIPPIKPEDQSDEVVVWSPVLLGCAAAQYRLSSLRITVHICDGIPPRRAALMVFGYKDALLGPRITSKCERAYRAQWYDDAVFWSRYH